MRETLNLQGELTEQAKQQIIDSIPASSLMFFAPALQGRHSTLLIDRSQNAANGTIANATWARTPRGIWYLVYNGSSAKVSLADAAWQDVGGALTVEQWIKTSTQNQSDKGLLEHDASAYKYLLYFTTNSQRIQWYTRNTTGIAISTYTGGVANFFADGVWRYIVGTYDRTLSSKRNKLYVNAVEVAFDNGWDENILVGDEGVTIGNYGGASWFTGSIALPRIENVALSATEILRRYTRERHLFGV